MSSSASKVGSGRTDLNIPTNTPSSKLNTVAFAHPIIADSGRAVKRQQTDRGSESSSEHRSTSNSRDQRAHSTSGVSPTEFIARTSTGTIRDATRFGKAQWETYFGDVGDEPSLPDNIDEILNSPCPFSGSVGTKVKDTHMLVLVPATVNGEDLTLDKLEQLIQNPQKGNKTKFCEYRDPQTKEEHGGTKVGRSHWVLMTRDILPGSRYKTYDDQKELVKQYAGQGYVVPDVIDAVVCTLMEFVTSGKYLYESLTYTRCAQTVKDGCPVFVGGFRPDGLVVKSIHCYAQALIGVAALRKF